MAFKETSRMEQRIALMREHDLGIFSVSALCQRFAISRETFYYWKQRRNEGGERWFEDRSHAAHECPHAMSSDVTKALLALRKRFVHFGPKKLRARLLQDHPKLVCPSASSIGALLRREGLIEAVKRRSRPVEQGQVIDVAQQSCEEWSMDFKGWFRTLDGTRCDPLTVSDTASRYLVGLQIIPARHDETQRMLTRLFKTYGLPQFLRSDNGSPFGSSGAGGLSRLAIWLLRHGVEPRFIPPGSPQHNGRHERMHRTLKAETSKPPAATARAQQTRFDKFRLRFNEERPHEALDQTQPSKHWTPSPRIFQTRLEDPWYDADHQVRRVRTDGTIRWKGEMVFIGEALHGQTIGLCEQDNGVQLVRFMHRELGVLRTDLKFQSFAPPRARFDRQADCCG
jgi:transposase InsO family protein